MSNHLNTTNPQYTILSWNVLAQSYARSRTYPYASSIALSWHHRKQLIHNILKQYDADILCLQEIDYYDVFYKDLLQQLGYVSIYINRSSIDNDSQNDTIANHTVNGKQKQKRRNTDAKFDGCLIAYKHHKFTHHTTDIHIIDYNHLANVHTNPTTQSQYMRHNIGIFVKLQCIDTHNEVLVCNTHLYWNPAYSDVKLKQCIYFIQCIEQYMNTLDIRPVVLMCADMNSVPSSDVYKYLTTGIHNTIHNNDIDTHDTYDTTHGTYKNVRLLVDVDMNKICRWLRAIGIDTEWFGQYNVKNNKLVSGVRNADQTVPFIDLTPDTMFQYAKQTKRIIVTRSKSVIQRSQCPTYIFIEPVRTAEQAFEDIVKYFNIQFDSTKFYSRCTVCNGTFIKIDRDELLSQAPDDLPSAIIERHGHDFNGKLLDFWRCTNVSCQQLYWWSNKSEQSKDKFEQWLNEKCMNNDMEVVKPTNYPTVASSKKFAYIRDRFENSNGVHEGNTNTENSDTDIKSNGNDKCNMHANTTIDYKQLAYSLIHSPAHTIYKHTLNLQSAYAHYHNNAEPPYTNYTATFRETLDYIFIDHNATIIDIKPLLTVEQCSIQTALPNENFPSDHLVLCATFTINNNNNNNNSNSSSTGSKLYKPDDPNVDHIYREPYHGNVYEPTDDTWLFMDALVQDQRFIVNGLQNGTKQHVVCEIGTGSGTIITYLYSILKHHNLNATYYATDRNPIAVQCANTTFQHNNVNIHAIQSDFVQSIQPYITQGIDILLFNPPYVPTDDNTLLQYDNIDAAYAGGVHGRVVIDRLLPLIPTILSEIGIFYMVLIPANKPDEIRSMMIQYGYTAEKVIEKQCQNELLQIWKYYQC